MRPFDANKFPEQLQELLSLSRGDFPEGHPFQSVRVVPTDVALPPIWLLGSSGASARLAGSLGLGYGFAAHFSATSPVPALEAYREAFEPSERFQQPHVILALSVVCADTEDEAEYLARSMDLAWVRLRRSEFGPLPSPEEATEYSYSPHERAIVEMYRSLLVHGTPSQVHDLIGRKIQETGANEVVASSMIHGHSARMRSYELLAEAFESASHEEGTPK
jgi:luciferase family oxidoreductase group 1